MIIYIARHGQTTGDIEDRYGGDYDGHLTEEGRKQASILSEKLKNKGIEVILTSPRIRAKETSEIISSSNSTNIIEVSDIRERNSYGILTGMVKSEAFSKYPKLTEEVRDPHNTIEGAELYSKFVERIDNALNDVKKMNYNKILLLTHGGPIRAIYRELLKLGEIDVADCAYFTLETINDSFSLVEMDGISIRDKK